MLRLPPFEFLQPRELDAALEALAGGGDTVRLVAGGTDLWPNMKRRHQSAERVVSMMAIPELAGLSESESGVTIGAATTLDRVAASPAVRRRYPALARAVLSISSPPLRNMGTIGGNLCLDTRCTYYNQTEEWRRSIEYCLKEEGDVCWVAPGSSVCWAHSASDTAPVLAALGASVTLVSSGGRRRLAVAELYRDDGIDYLTKDPGEILTAIEIPELGNGWRAAFWKLRRRGSIDFAVLSVAAAARLDADGAVAESRLFLGAVASAPRRVERAEEILAGSRLEEDAIRAAAVAARRAATPMDNTDFRVQWRGVMVERYAAEALRELAGREPLGPPPPHPSL